MQRNTALADQGWLTSYRFVVGPNGSGRWIVADRLGRIGGLFIDRDTALNFVKAEATDGPACHPGDKGDPGDLGVAEVQRLELSDLFALEKRDGDMHR